MSPPVTSSISFVKKSERLSHKFNICGTPSSSPVDTSHGNKNPILNSKLPSGSLRYSEEFSDDSPNHSEDEAILTECIQSAMLKVSFKNNERNILICLKKNISDGICHLAFITMLTLLFYKLGPFILMITIAFT